MMDPSTFDYLKPTEEQAETMAKLRKAAAAYARVLDDLLPMGNDKDHAIRLVRAAAMWANVAVTRDDYGGPRQ